MKEIPLTQRMVAQVPDECFDELICFKWFAHKECQRHYALRWEDGNNWEAIRMHRIIFERMMGSIPEGKQIDHINGDGLNNTIENLRICTPDQNRINRSKCKNPKMSKYKGVRSSGVRWGARVKQIWIGTFDSEIEAAKAYDRKAKELYGEFACLNFP